jgi:hypothetical protein
MWVKGYDACLTEIPVGDVHLYKEKVKEKIENLREAFTLENIQQDKQQ